MQKTVEDKESKQPILDFIFEEANAGRPTALQVTQVDSDKGDRHWVTVIGYAASVDSASGLNADTLLVMDTTDGKIHKLSLCGLEGRDLYNNGVYKVNGATDLFLSEVVYKDKDSSNQNITGRR